MVSLESLQQSDLRGCWWASIAPANNPRLMNELIHLGVLRAAVIVIIRCWRWAAKFGSPAFSI